MTITGQSPNFKMFKSLVLAATIAACAGSVDAAPGRPAARRPASGRPVQLMRQAPVADSASGREYSGRLWNRILNQWDYPNGNNHVTIVATVSADGNVENTQVTSSPKSPEAEAAAQAAFEKAKPLEALPKGMLSAKVTMLFNSKADPHGDSSSGGSVRLDAIHSTGRSTPPPESEPEPQAEMPQAETPQSKPESKPETKPEAKPEAKPAAKAEAKPVKVETSESKTEVKTETKPDVKTEVKPETKPSSGGQDEFGGH